MSRKSALMSEDTVRKIDLEARPGAWEIAPGRTVDAWMYNGRVPGPVIEARVGETLVVRLTNHLPEPTTIHWHGLRIPAVMDGTELVQLPVEPGETFEYRFTLLDAGTFWYHPHSNEPVQMERGLYGALIVREDDEPVVDGERVLVFDDIRLGWTGQIARGGGWLERHNGREGGIRLVNGRVDPEIQVSDGRIERWRVVNAASARYIRLSVAGRPFRILGTDGGLIERPFGATEVLLAPGDRFDLAVGPFKDGERLAVESLPYDRGLGKKKAAERLAHIRVGPASDAGTSPASGDSPGSRESDKSDMTVRSRARIPERLRQIEALADPSTPPNREVRLGGRMSLRRGVDFLIDGHPHHDADPVCVGELQVWDVINETPLDHPFHLHGFFFQVVEKDGTPPPYRSWEDTVNVPAKGRVRIAWLPDDRPGNWMYHCHILEHAVAGMMAHFQVVGARGSVPAPVAHSHHSAR